MRVKGITVWQKSDLDGFFGLFTNNITNILVMVGALVYTVGLPVDLVYGRIMPALGVGMALCSACYFYFGYRMARKEGRDTVTAMPTASCSSLEASVGPFPEPSRHCSQVETMLVMGFSSISARGTSIAGGSLPRNATLDC